MRSSALEDGGARCAFPGAYESYLNVNGIDELKAAVKRVWASLWNGRAAGFRAALGVDGEPAMAVIVQEMVEADVSGVSMTANPVTGDPNRVSIAWTREPEETAHCEIDLGDMASAECPSRPADTARGGAVGADRRGLRREDRGRMGSRRRAAMAPAGAADRRPAGPLPGRMAG